MSLPGANTTQTDLYEWLSAYLAAELKVPQTGIDPDEPLVTYGLDSLTAAMILEAVEERVGFEVDANAVWDNPTAGSFAAFLADQIAARE